jgi:3-deoxy-manno-octulosonate cytidylyltransferase (CMP-KDO synthetase)
MKTTICIPCRLASTRMPNKMLADIDGTPLIACTYFNALMCKDVDVVVLTDSAEIYEKCTNLSVNVILHQKEAFSGTHRISNAVKAGLLNGDIFINLQGDEPLFETENIHKFVEFSCLFPEDRCTATKEDLNKEDGVVYAHMDGPYAVKFSRTEKTNTVHVGIYSYDIAFLRSFDQTNVLDLEQVAFLPLRAIHLQTNSISVDTQEDFDKVIEIKHGTN